MKFWNFNPNKPYVDKLYFSSNKKFPISITLTLPVTS